MSIFKNQLLKFCHEGEDDQQLETNSTRNRTTTKKRLVLSDANGLGFPMDGSTRRSRLGYICHGSSKALGNDKAEEPVAMLPAALVDALIGVREEKIHSLEGVISSVQDKYEQEKLMYSAKLKIYWSLGRCSKEKFQGHCCKELHRPTSAPVLQWGRRKQLASLLGNKRRYGKNTWQVSQEDHCLQSEWRRAGGVGLASRLPPAASELEVQLWMWMEEVGEVERQLASVERERDGLRDELESTAAKGRELEGQLNTLKINEAKEKIRTLKMKGEMERLSKCLDECNTRYNQAMQSKDEELSNLRKTLAVQAETLQNLQATCRELQGRNEWLEKDKKEKDGLLLKLEILDDQLQERQAIMEALMEDANQRAECLARAKERFHAEVQRWEREAESVREEISRVERQRDDALADVQRIQSKCAALEENKDLLVRDKEAECVREEEMSRVERQRDQSLAEVHRLTTAMRDLESKCAALEEDKGRLLRDKEMLEARLRDQLALAEAQFAQEVSKRVEIEKRMQEMADRTLRLEENLKRETGESEALKKDMKRRLEAEHARALDVLLKNHRGKLAEERLRAEALQKELERERELKASLQGTIEDELRKQSVMERKRDSLLQEKQSLEEKLETEMSIKQDLEAEISTLKNNLLPERVLLQKTKVMLDEEILKNEEAHERLSASMAEVLKKERLIKTLKGDLTAKEKDLLQMKLKYDSFAKESGNGEDCLKEYKTDRSRLEEMTKTCDSLTNRLTEAEKARDAMERAYVECRNSLETEMVDLREQLRSESSRAVREATLKHILKRGIVALERGLDEKTTSLREAVTRREDEKARLEQELSRKQKLHGEEVRAMQESHRVEVASLEERNAGLAESVRSLKRKQELHEEDSRNVEESLRGRIALLEEQSAEWREQLRRSGLAHEQQVERLSAELESERRGRLESERAAEERAAALERLRAEGEARLEAEREQLRRERQGLSEDLEFLNGGSGDAAAPRVAESAREAEARLRGLQAYHQRLLDAVCARSAAREAAVKHAAELEVARARRDSAQALAQVERGRAGERRERGVQTVAGDGEEGLPARGEGEEWGAGRSEAAEKGTGGSERRSCQRSATLSAILDNGGSSRGSGPPSSIDETESSMDTRDARENVRVTKSDGRFMMGGGKDNYHSCKRNVETNIRRYLNHVKNSFKNEGSLRVVPKGEAASDSKDLSARKSPKNGNPSKSGNPRGKPWNYGMRAPSSSCNSISSRELVSQLEPTPPSDGPRVKPLVGRTKEPVRRREKTSENLIIHKVDSPKGGSSLEGRSRKNRKPASNTALIEITTITMRPRQRATEDKHKRDL